ncbi:hypothetical protein C8C82_0390 [Flavobacterium sp. 81]|uniref:hypothetical protein n=1 Tax=Flavobacterium sp. 81 TaxID=2135621 RepID=UPI000F272130|nr:hypothetical protein [Flavobacterium sp. 81]RKR08516.1 hypothetical protein C8C82_0390 [Flavobacterium sp. 81]
MKLLTQKKPRDFRITNVSNKEIKLTILSLLALTFQASAASSINTSTKNNVVLFFEKNDKG